jgi:hypothetical protein
MRRFNPAVPPTVEEAPAPAAAPEEAPAAPVAPEEAEKGGAES